MKSLTTIISSIVLVSCASAPIPAPTQIENPAPVPVQIAAGHTDTMSYRCEQKEINPSLVWLDCSFENRNLSGNMGASSTCIDVSYWMDGTGRLAYGKRLCSNPLVPTEGETKF